MPPHSPLSLVTGTMVHLMPSYSAQRVGGGREMRQHRRGSSGSEGGPRGAGVEWAPPGESPSSFTIGTGRPREASMRSWVPRRREAATIFMAAVILLIFPTERMRCFTASRGGGRQRSAARSGDLPAAVAARRGATKPCPFRRPRAHQSAGMRRACRPAPGACGHASRRPARRQPVSRAVWTASSVPKTQRGSHRTASVATRSSPLATLGTAPLFSSDAPRWSAWARLRRDMPARGQIIVKTNFAFPLRARHGPGAWATPTPVAHAVSLKKSLRIENAILGTHRAVVGLRALREDTGDSEEQQNPPAGC